MGYLDRLKARVAENASPDQPTKPAEPRFAGFVGSSDGFFSLPDDVCAGIERLKRMRVPRLLPARLWPGFVADAVWIAEHGIAADAMQQGWSAVDLFGVSRDESWQCLAAWIGGRRDDHGRACYLLTEIRGERTLPYAVQAAGISRRWHYPEPAPSDAVLPWSM